MDDLRFSKIELGMAELKRRVTDHDEALEKDRKDITMLQDIAKSNKEILDAMHSLNDYAKKTYEVFEPLARDGAKIVKYSAVFVAAWHGIKWAYHKFMLFT